jgi:hypothetical protein
VTGWAPTFDALVALHHDDAGTALARLDADPDDEEPWNRWLPAMWLPWYAALWAEASVLTAHPDSEQRLDRARNAAHDNPIATAIVQRSADLHNHRYDTLADHAQTFAALGCRYQYERTNMLLSR